MRPVSVMDREAEVSGLFVEQRRLGTVDVLVPDKHNCSPGKGVRSCYTPAARCPRLSLPARRPARSQAPNRKSDSRIPARAGN